MLDSATSQARQQVLQLWLKTANLDAEVVAWSFYDGAAAAKPAVDNLPVKPPYGSALEAMRDGWRVVGIAPARVSTPGHEHRTSFRPHEVVLERLQHAAA